MKKFLIFSIILAYIPFTGVAQNAPDAQQIEELIQKSFDVVFSEKDLSKFDDFYTEDFILLEHGEVWDKEKIEQMMLMIKDDPSERINEFDFIEVKINGDMAWVAYHNKAIFKRNGTITGELNWLESATAIKTEDGWRLEMLHSTRKPQAEK